VTAAPAPPVLPAEAPLRESAPFPSEAQRAKRAFRPRRVLPAVLSALLLAVAAIALAMEDISTKVSGKPDLVPNSTFGHLARQTQWSSHGVLAVGAAAAAIGVVLLVLALVPGRSRLLPVQSADPQTVTGISRHSLRRYLADAATTVDGISSASVRLHRKSVTVIARSHLRDISGLRPGVTEAVQDRLDSLRPLTPLALRTKLRRKED
jgi:hypothetical protein